MPQAPHTVPPDPGTLQDHLQNTQQFAVVKQPECPAFGKEIGKPAIPLRDLPHGALIGKPLLFYGSDFKIHDPRHTVGSKQLMEPGLRREKRSLPTRD